MKGVKEPVKYKSLSIPEPLFNEFKKYVQSNPNYRNMAEFLRQSLREKMQREIELAQKLAYAEEEALVTAKHRERLVEHYKEMEDLKKELSQGRIIFKKDIKRIDKHGTPEERKVLAKMREKSHDYFEEKEKQEERWDKEFLEYQYKHSSPEATQEAKRLLKKKYKREKKEIPVWLSDEQKSEITTLVENVVAKMLEKKDKKETS